MNFDLLHPSCCDTIWTFTVICSCLVWLKLFCEIVLRYHVEMDFWRHLTSTFNFLTSAPLIPHFWHSALYKLINNNSKTVFMVLSSWQSHCENSAGLFDECRTAPSGRRPKTKPDLGCESACTCCQSLHPPSPFIIITQPVSWYSFYRPTEGRRLSRPSWLVTCRDRLPVQRRPCIARRSPILALTGSDVAQLRWSRPTRYH